MKNLTFLAGVLALALVPTASGAQTARVVQFPNGWAPGVSVCVQQISGTCVPVSAANPLPVTGGGGGSGGGDASAANQTTQITAENLTNTTLGAVTASPTAYTIGDRLKTLNTTLGSPFQAGGSIGNTAFGASQSGAWNITNVTGAVSLPTGAATATNQATANTSLATLTGKCWDANGVICSPKAGTSDRVVTKTSMAADTSTSICPVVSSGSPVTTEVQAAAGGVGLGVNGQTLTGAVLGTTTSDPDILMPVAAGNYYIFPVAPTNAVTARSSTAQVVTCIQTKRQ